MRLSTKRRAYAAIEGITLAISLTSLEPVGARAIRSPTTRCRPQPKTSHRGSS